MASFADVKYPYPEKYVDARGVRVCAVDEGRGDPIIFLPPVGRSIPHYELVYGAFLKTHRVIGLDLPGSGKSDKPDAPYTVDWFLSMLPAILDALAVGPATFVGNSLGGRLAKELAMRQPVRVRGVVALAPIALRPSAVSRAVIKRTFNERAWMRPRETAIREAAARSFHAPHPEIDVIVSRTLEFCSTPDWPPYVRALVRAVHSAIDLAPPKYAIAAPLVVAWGDDDRMLPITWMKKLPGRHVVIPDCGHFPPIERPDDVAALVRGLQT